MTKILTVDPGKKVKSFAYVLLNENKKVLKHGYLGTTLPKISHENQIYFYSEFYSLLEYFAMKKGDHVTIEKYYAAGMNRRGHSEAYINMMLGIAGIACLDMGIDMHMYQASTWKTAFKKKYKKYADEYFPKVNGLEKHEADACGIGYYFIDNRLKK